MNQKEKVSKKKRDLRFEARREKERVAIVICGGTGPTNVGKAVILKLVDSGRAALSGF